MSEYGEPHSVAKLIGSPPGYVGYEREGLLISQLRTRPHCVVLFDEIEKAHPNVFDVFLQIFDEGRLSGAHGRTADFTQAVIILTSNLRPAAVEPAPRALGFATTPEPDAVRPAVDPRAALAGLMRLELINRFDEVIVFQRLGPVELSEIVGRYIGEVDRALAEQGFALRVEDGVREHLLALGDTDHFGARELRRVVDRTIRQPAAREILRRDRGSREIRVALQGGSLAIQ
jgi:ATP-dependent Clp protease ATP-binding subunit ClpA